MRQPGISVSDVTRRRAVAAGHEGGDQGSIRIAEAEGVTAVDGFTGQAHLQRIQGTVHIHDQQVQAVATRAVARGNGANGFAGELVVVTFGYRKRLQTLRKAPGFRHFSRSQRFQHVGDIGQGILDDCMRFRYAVAPAVHLHRIAHHTVQVAVLDSCRHALGDRGGRPSLQARQPQDAEFTESTTATPDGPSAVSATP
jgi:hypothetical protein